MGEITVAHDIRHGLKANQQIRADGLRRRDTFDLGLVLNELCTNSVKYGSLGGDDGIVSLAWNISGQPESRTFHIRWDDPVTKVARAPSSSSNGFGTKLIQQLVVSKWHGTIDVQVHERYLMKIDIPLSSISDGTTH